MNRYPIDDELRKKPLNPEMIRYRLQNELRGSLLALCIFTPLLLVGMGGFTAFFWTVVLWQRGGPSAVIAGILITGLVLFLAGILLYRLVTDIKAYRRASRGELCIEIDTVDYIEYDRPRIIKTRHARRTIYEDFRHFKSGREFKDECLEARDKAGDEFITVAYAAEPEHIIYAYRLSEYNWQA